MPMAPFFLSVICLALAACAPEQPGAVQARTGVIQNRAVDEASGVQAGWLNPDALFVHNDDGAARLFVTDAHGRDLGSVSLVGTANRDWEDITAVQTESGPLLVIADVGDNAARREHVVLYFLAEPTAGADGRYRGDTRPKHRLALRYPDGPRDCESVAFDPVARRLLLLTKRDVPPRIYGIELSRSLAADSATLDFLGQSYPFRPPGPADPSRFGAGESGRVSRPTGFDISRDGSRAAVITYRSLYLFQRVPGEDWVSALGRRPIEFQAPPGRREEAVSFLGDNRHLVVTGEGSPAPVYRFQLKPATP